ncbi:hypothetical protein CAPTEDRAFT_101277 [Capitella teleta]|uniref:NHR domain-containing protein n=1 Tax=Capitella teleta TaxID=283909 RepID=R7TVJ5_CAPTE|nr:hypothetical protein CAPTEDRAFT_101277 [Capitella teleta]|eukprot:ELT95486.1 hypothetical protein CAPTEDRAFT_101277 [Capitella teleta]
MFHQRTGSLVALSNENRTAQRKHPVQEFNNGVVLSAEPIKDSQIFEVRIDRKVNSWSGSIEIGVTTCDPCNLNFPTSATGFLDATWVMSGTSIMKDGCTLIEHYGDHAVDLDQLGEGDRVGVMRSEEGALHFFVNGVDQGVAAHNVPSVLYAVIDMYGKCAQVSILDSASEEHVVAAVNSNIIEAAAEAPDPPAAAAAMAASASEDPRTAEMLAFHQRCGSLVVLSNLHRTAERKRPLDEFNNGVVMTSRPLLDDELFEIRLDHLVDKWSGSIEVGITTHNPSLLEFPATMTNMRAGLHSTIMMSGCGILTNGKGTRREYGQFNLDELQEGDRIGLVRKSSGALHYFINGIDQGVAAPTTPRMVWGVVDLYGMAVKVTILDASESERAVVERASNTLRLIDVENEDLADAPIERLLFHPRCGCHAAVINGQRTAHRPNAMDDFNNGVVLTNRTLQPNEMFEVRLDMMVDKWAGSVEIGVTMHAPTELDFPSTMTNIRSGTWMMTGNGVMHNGTTVIDDYGTNLDRLKVGDSIGMMRKEDGTLHFYVNGMDQGAAATNVPSAVYGVLDLYGQAAQATMIDISGGWSSDPTSFVAQEMVSRMYTDDDLRFHVVHGKNSTISPSGKTAARPNALAEFNDAIVMSSRPLKDNELFEVSIDRMVDRWSGSIEAGVSLIIPEDLDFPNTMTDIDHDTWMLSGSAIMQDGCTIRNRYNLDLDNIVTGSRIGMMRCSDATLHYYFDGVDQGVACSDIPSGVYAVIDLYGQCSQVTITSGSGVMDQRVAMTTTENPAAPLDCAVSPAETHHFSCCAGKNIVIENNGSTASRMQHFSHALVFSADPLRVDELFEVRIEKLSSKWSGSLQVGLTSMAVCDTTPASVLPPMARDLKSKATWIVTGSEVKKCGVTVKENYAPSLERLQVNDRVGIRRAGDGTFRVYINGEDMGVAASNIPRNVFALLDLYGRVESVTVTSRTSNDNMASSLPPSIPSLENSLEVLARCPVRCCVEHDEDTALSDLHLNLSKHGKNIRICQRGMRAERISSYNQAICVSAKPLARSQVFKVRIENTDPKWTSSLSFGVLGFNPEKISLPVSALNIKKPAWVVSGDSVFFSGVKVKDGYGPGLDGLSCGHTIGLRVDPDSSLHLLVNDVDQGIAAKDVPPDPYVVLDLYGQCQLLQVVSADDPAPSTVAVEYREKADIEDGKRLKQDVAEKSRSSENFVKNCEYRNMCSRFKTLLGLPDGYFQGEKVQCYCETCHKIRGDEPYYSKGEPPKDYAVPFGWCRFPLRVTPKIEVLQIFEKWHTAYHGCHSASVRRILDTGDLHVAGEGGITLRPHSTQSEEKNKPEEKSNVRQIVLSPTVKYAGCQSHAPKFDYRDLKSKKMQSARVVYQVCVKPGSYKIGPQTVGANEQIDPKFSNTELQWSTKEKGAVILSALLIQVQ